MVVFLVSMLILNLFYSLTLSNTEQVLYNSRSTTLIPADVPSSARPFVSGQGFVRFPNNISDQANSGSVDVYNYSAITNEKNLVIRGTQLSGPFNEYILISQSLQLRLDGHEMVILRNFNEDSRISIESIVGTNIHGSMDISDYFMKRDSLYIAIIATNVSTDGTEFMDALFFVKYTDGEFTQLSEYLYPQGKDPEELAVYDHRFYFTPNEGETFVSDTVTIAFYDPSEDTFGELRKTVEIPMIDGRLPTNTSFFVLEGRLFLYLGYKHQEPEILMRIQDTETKNSYDLVIDPYSRNFDSTLRRIVTLFGNFAAVPAFEVHGKEKSTQMVFVYPDLRNEFTNYTEYRTFENNTEFSIFSDTNDVLYLVSSYNTSVYVTIFNSPSLLVKSSPIMSDLSRGIITAVAFVSTAVIVILIERKREGGGGGDLYPEE